MKTLHHGIAFTGLGKSGKSTSAGYLVERYGWIRVGFADKLKYELASMLAGQESEGDPFRFVMLRDQFFRIMSGPSTPQKEQLRRMMQGYGQWWRERDEDHWLQPVAEAINLCQAKSLRAGIIPGPAFVCDDLRHVNEAQMLTSLGFVIVRLERLEAGLGVHAEHESEKQVAKVEATKILHNNGPLEGLFAKLDELALEVRPNGMGCEPQEMIEILTGIKNLD